MLYLIPLPFAEKSVNKIGYHYLAGLKKCDTSLEKNDEKKSLSGLILY